MCLITCWKFPRITLKERVVYKIVFKVPFDEEVCYSAVIKFKYQYNILYRESIFKYLWVNKLFSPFNGFTAGWIHSYNSIETAIDNKDEYLGYPRDTVIVKCIIPRFTLYYKGLHDNICSKKIKIIEKCV